MSALKYTINEEGNIEETYLGVYVQEWEWNNSQNWIELCDKLNDLASIEQPKNISEIGIKYGDIVDLQVANRLIDELRKNNQNLRIEVNEMRRYANELLEYINTSEKHRKSIGEIRNDLAD